MNSEILAFIAAFGYGLGDFLTGPISKKFDQATFFFWSTLLRSIVSGVALLFFSSQLFLHSQDVFVIILLGIFYFIGNATFLYSVSQTGIGLTTILGNINPIYVFVLSFLFQSNTVSLIAWFGVIVACIGIILIYVKNTTLKKPIHLFLAFLPGFIWGSSYVVQQPLLERNNAYVLNFWYFIIWIPCALIYLYIRKEKPQFPQTSQSQLLTIQALLYTGTAVLSTVAFSLGNVSIISAIHISSVIFTLFLARIFYKERYSLIQKCGIIITLLGVLLVSIS